MVGSLKCRKEAEPFKKSDSYFQTFDEKFSDLLLADYSTKFADLRTKICDSGLDQEFAIC